MAPGIPIPLSFPPRSKCALKPVGQLELRFGRGPGWNSVQFSARSRLTNPTRSATVKTMDAPIQLPIDGVLDLHTFRPREVKDLVLDYLAECQLHGILRVRIIHGKGIGNLRRTVHAALAKHPEVVSYSLASEPFGGWGATIVHLREGKKD